MSVPFAKTVRGYSMFGTSFVYLIFEDGTDIYGARSRVLEYLNTVSDDLPAKASPALGPDASGVGWVYQYSLRDSTGQHELDGAQSVYAERVMGGTFLDNDIRPEQAAR
jgi:copper/silver efflux system protein